MLSQAQAYLADAAVFDVLYHQLRLAETYTIADYRAPVQSPGEICGECLIALRVLDVQPVHVEYIAQARAPVEHEIAVEAVLFESLGHPVRVEQPVQPRNMARVREDINQVTRSQCQLFVEREDEILPNDYRGMRVFRER